MEHRICVVPVMPLRAEPSHKSEMTSQLLFGECAVMLEQRPGGWVKLRNQYDQYEGWGTENQLTPIDEDLYFEPTEEFTPGLLDCISVSGHPMNVPLGSFLKGIRHGEMFWGKVTAVFKGDPLKPDSHPIAEKRIRQIAFQYLNTPYLWGGRSIFGIDCSGFTQSVFQLLGKRLPRDAHMQAGCGEKRNEGEKAHCGDLAFFRDDDGKIGHIGIMLNEFEIIHASGKVRVDKLDEHGILNADTGKHTHRLAGVTRII